MAYMDIFDDPLAPTYHNANAKDGLPQMDRSARPAEVESDPSLTDMALEYGKDKAMSLADEKGTNFFNEKVMPKAKDFFSMFSPDKAVASNAGTASSLANQAAMVDAAGLTGAEIAAGAGSKLATGAGAELAAAKMAEQGALGALTGAGTTTAATTGAAGAGGMAALGAAVPYIGAGLLAAKAFGLFSEGGKAGPLYANKGAKAKEEDESFFQGLAESLSKAKDYAIGKGRAGEKSKDFLQGYRSEGGPMYAGMGLIAMANKMKEEEMMPVGPLALRKIKYKQDGGKIELEATMGD